MSPKERDDAPPLVGDAGPHPEEHEPRGPARVAGAHARAGTVRPTWRGTGGETEPVATDDTADGEQANRRVEVLIRGVEPPETDGGGLGAALLAGLGAALLAGRGRPSTSTSPVP